MRINPNQLSAIQTTHTALTRLTGMCWDTEVINHPITGFLVVFRRIAHCFSEPCPGVQYRVYGTPTISRGNGIFTCEINGLERSGTIVDVGRSIAHREMLLDLQRDEEQKGVE